MSITTGSGLERYMSCDASSILPRVFNQNGSEAATRGTVVHAYLERLSLGMTVEEALDAIEGDDRKHREACAAIVVERLEDLIELSPELSLACNPSKGTARVLGRGLERDYEGAGITDDEIPLTIDVTGVNVEARRGFLADYKTGWAKLPAAGNNWQMRGGAIALALAFDLDEVEVHVVYLRDNEVVRRDRHVFTAADLAEIGEQLRLAWDRTLMDREAFSTTGMIPVATMGGHCKYCPSRSYCPAYTGLIRAVVAPDDVRDNPLSIGRLTTEQLGDAYRKVKAAKKALEEIMSAICVVAAENPILIETKDNGDELWLGLCDVKGNDKLDPEKSLAALLEALNVDKSDAKARLEIFESISKKVIVKKQIEETIKSRVPHGFMAKTMRSFLASLDEAGGISNSSSIKVTPFIVTRKMLSK